MTGKFSEELQAELEPLWAELMQSRLVRALFSDEPVRIEILQLYLIESYHYVKHNAQHQAMAVWRTDVRRRDFMRAALQHALEEVDHDQLALRDLEKMGFRREEVERSSPLPETRMFNAFLYDWVCRENPVGRLGYSAWAENTQSIGGAFIARIKEKFGIQDDRALSFFVAHAHIDMRHGREALENIDRFALTADDRTAVRTVAVTTFRLFLGMLDAIYERYGQVLEGAPVLRD